MRQGKQLWLIYGVVTGLGTGFLPAPGTMGSLLAFLLFLILPPLSPFHRFAFLVILFGLSVYAIHLSQSLFSENDPPSIVIDEIVGMFLVLFMLPPSWSYWIAGFCLFRFFDIWKPFPLRAMERLPGGWGIMADDIGAAIYALLILMIF